MTHKLCTTTAALSIAASFGAAGAASAQTACGGSYQIEPGDTLYSVSQQCRVALSTIMDLNPNLDVDAIPVGATIDLAARAGGGTDRAAGEGSYRVEQGDTAFSIAATLGLTLQELMAENPDLDPLSMAIGEVLDLPEGDRSATVNLNTTSGPPGSEVVVMARGLRPDDWVTIGAGRVASEWRRLREVQVAPDGEIRAEVQVPDWADSRDRLTFVVDTDRGLTYKSADFNVTARAGDDRDDRDGRDGDGDEIALEGRVDQGTECYTLTTVDGDEYAIVSDNVNFTEGEFVRVEGERAEMSFCQQGEATIDVENIQEVRAPG
jgi:LysM repeat protein